jgi:hypothetical protein
LAIFLVCLAGSVGEDSDSGDSDGGVRQGEDVQMKKMGGGVLLPQR